jgi:hypothetical protein
MKFKIKKTYLRAQTTRLASFGPVSVIVNHPNPYVALKT